MAYRAILPKAPFLCFHCERSFSTHAELDEHNRQMSLTIKLCQLCHAACCDDVALASHLAGSSCPQSFAFQAQEYIAPQQSAFTTSPMVPMQPTTSSSLMMPPQPATAPGNVMLPSQSVTPSNTTIPQPSPSSQVETRFSTISPARPRPLLPFEVATSKLRPLAPRPPSTQPQAYGFSSFPTRENRSTGTQTDAPARLVATPKPVISAKRKADTQFDASRRPPADRSSPPVVIKQEPGEDIQQPAAGSTGGDNIAGTGTEPTCLHLSAESMKAIQKMIETAVENTAIATMKAMSRSRTPAAATSTSSASSATTTSQGAEKPSLFPWMKTTAQTSQTTSLFPPRKLFEPSPAIDTVPAQTSAAQAAPSSTPSGSAYKFLKEKSTDCPSCKFQYNSWSALLQHLGSGNCNPGINSHDLERFASEHGSPASTKDSYGCYTCLGCSSKYALLSSLYNHIETANCDGRFHWPYVSLKHALETSIRSHIKGFRQ